ncbi:MAG: hypothetical protein GXY82_08385 [Methanospirillum sp.]|nr:hypothetical protein [Methanospirillum sp.]
MKGFLGFCTAVLATLAVLLAISAGCIGGPETVADHDLVVVKLAPDGATQWTRIIDTGEDDGAEDLVELPDGGFGIAARNGSDARGPARPRLVRLSPDGAVLWDRFVTDGFDIARVVVPAGDGGTAVLTGNGTVVRFDTAGQVRWSRSTGISEAQALRQLADGGYVAGGRVTYRTATNITPPPVPGASAVTITASTSAGGEGMATRLSADGVVLWERRYGESGLVGVLALAESPDRAGLLLAGDGTMPNASAGTPLLALPLDTAGTPGTVTQLGTVPLSDPVWIRSDPAGYRVLYQNTSLAARIAAPRGVVDATLDRDGRVLDRQPIDASIAVTWTADGGYFSVGIPSGGGEPGYGTATSDRTSVSALHARRLDSAGTPVWERALPTGLLSRVLKVVQTSDGGFAVLALRDTG